MCSPAPGIRGFQREFSGVEAQIFDPPLTPVLDNPGGAMGLAAVPGRGVEWGRGDGTETRRRWLKRAVPCPGRALQAGAMRARALPAPVVAQAAPAAHVAPKSISIPAGPL